MLADMGSGSMQLARVFGIRIGVNASWFLVLFLSVFLLSDAFAASVNGSETAAYAASVAASLGFFASILLHELGHALAARRAGIEVTGIDLFFFGGLMHMSRDTDSPGDEFKVAAAGPAVTLLLIVAGALLAAVLAGSLTDLSRVATLADRDTASVLELLVSFLVSMNVLLLALNLVPAFPLDGGRMARALIWKLTGSRARATRLSARLGQAFGLLLAAFGLALALQGSLLNGFWMLALGWLLHAAARTAVVQSTVSEELEAITVGEVMEPEPVVIPAGLDAQQAWDDFFLRYGDRAAFPVIDEQGRPLGVAKRDDFATALIGWPSTGTGLDSAGAEAVHGHDSGGDQRASDPSGELRVAGDLAQPWARASLVRADDTVDALIASSELRAQGLVPVVDDDGKLQGVVTPAGLARALSAASGAALRRTS